jgi:hypothetical protein
LAWPPLSPHTRAEIAPLGATCNSPGFLPREKNDAGKMHPPPGCYPRDEKPPSRSCSVSVATRSTSLVWVAAVGDRKPLETPHQRRSATRVAAGVGYTHEATPSLVRETSFVTHASPTLAPPAVGDRKPLETPHPRPAAASLVRETIFDTKQHRATPGLRAWRGAYRVFQINYLITIFLTASAVRTM